MKPNSLDIKKKRKLHNLLGQGFKRREIMAKTGLSKSIIKYYRRPELAKARQIAYYQKNRDKIVEKMRVYRLKKKQ